MHVPNLTLDFLLGAEKIWQFYEFLLISQRMIFEIAFLALTIITIIIIIIVIIIMIIIIILMKIITTTKSYYIYNPAGWDVSERSQSDVHWDSHLRDLSETFQKRLPLWEVFKTFQKHLRKYVFCVASLRRFKPISKKCLFRDVSEIYQNYLSQVFMFFKNIPRKWFSVISVWFLKYTIK